MKAKYINENIGKYNFERKENKLSSLGIGRKQFIEKWLDEMEIENYTINDDYTINVDGNVKLEAKNLVQFPEYIQFNIVKGWFDCSNNKLISLRGCPKSVYTVFYCYNNQLEILEGCPKYVGINFECQHNKKQFTEKYVRSLCEVKGKVYY